MRSALAALAGLALAAGCAATSNPDRTGLAPIQTTPKAPVEGAAAGREAPAGPGGAAAPGPGQGTANAPAAAQTPAPASTSAAGAAGELALGSIGDQPVGAREFLRRLWVDDNAQARRVLEQIVFARLAELEADRFGMRLVEGSVDAAVERAVAQLEKKLAEKGSKLTLDQHVERNLELDPQLYRTNLRRETIVQMLAERCVRAWFAENERCLVRLTEIRDPEALGAAKKELEEGHGFDQIAKAHGLGDDPDLHTTKMTVVRAEAQELARMVFATPPGQVGGPLEQNGRWLYFVVDQRLEGREAPWSALRAEVETSLDAQPVSNLEFLQWRSAMVRRYRVDLEPFFELVEAKGP